MGIQLSGYRKAIAGGLVSAASWLAGATANNDGISGAEWGALPLAFLVGAGVVAAVKNSSAE